MKKHLWVGALAALCFTGISGIASASSHREAPAISNDPAADNTDLWAWMAPGAHDKVYVVASYIPLEEPSGGPNYNSFSDEVLYEIHIARGAASLDDAYTYQVEFKTDRGPYVSQKDVADVTKGLGGGKEFFSQLSGFKQTYSVTKIDWTGKKPVETIIVKDAAVAPPNIGPRTDAVAYGLTGGRVYDDAFAATFIKPTSDGGRVFVGPRDDGFYVNIGRIFDLANILSGTAQDNVAGFNCHTIALEIPTTQLAKGGTIPTGASNDGTLGIWASASRRKVRVLRHDGSSEGLGPWVQVSRLGFPLVNEAVIGIQDKDKYNRTKPAADVANFGSYFLYPIIVRDAEAVGLYTALGVDSATVAKLKTGLAGDGKGRLDIINTLNLTDIPSAGAHSIPLSSTGDVLRLDMGVDSGFPNGRPIPGPAPNKENADVTDVIVDLIVAGNAAAGIPIDGVDHNDTSYLTTFPYLALPWQGFGQAHGK